MINKFTFDNGLRVITEKIDYVKSVSIGIWIKVGSSNENISTNGMSHFIEHMLFKGTKNKKANEIAEFIDNLGGQLNAFTSKECTCYYVKVLDENIDEAIDLLSDMFFNSLFDETDIEKEKSVICEEIKMYEDSPEDVVHEKLSKIMFDGSSLSYPILGTIENINTFNKSNITNYKKENYTPFNTVISAAGNFDEEEFIKKLKDKFSTWNSSYKEVNNKEIDYKHNIEGINKDLEQLHICIGSKGIGRHNKLYYPLLIFNNIFGGTMSSRLFQELRENKGLVYTVYSYVSSYSNCGLFATYAALMPDYLEKALELIRKEIKDMKNGNISREEFERAKQQIKGNYILGLESTSSRMTSIGRRELIYDEIVYPDQIIDRINKIDYSDVIKVVETLFKENSYSIAYAGNLNKYNITKDKIIKSLGGKCEN